MVKLFCNRCEAEIKDKYYTISFYRYDANQNPVDYYNDNTSTSAIITNLTTNRIGALALLNSQETYCIKCKEAIEKFINNKQ
jgi:hypothetical protein